MERVRAAGRRLLGTELRELQVEAVSRLLERDTMVVSAPGSGKTAIYAVAGTCLGGLTVVVSPTLSLQRDQVAALREMGLRAEAVNSTRSTGRRERVLTHAADLDMLLLAPEQLANEEVLDRLAAAKPALLVVDEAHCVAEWGHDFRPDYLGLAAAAAALGRPRVLALTATASRAVREEVLDRLAIPDAAVLVHDTDRPEIHLAVELHPDRAATLDAARAQAVDLVERGSAPGIVYVNTPRRADELAELLATDGLRAGAYHGRQRAAARHETQDAFMADRLGVVVASSAFGMGIDKPNVRFVLHAELPPSVDAYFQQVGRAARDGEPATAVLHHDPGDHALPRSLAAGPEPDPELLAAVVEAVRAGARSRQEVADRVDAAPRSVARVLPPLLAAGAVRERGRSLVPGSRGPAGKLVEAAADAARRRHEIEMSRVDLVRRYAETTGCRRATLLELLGDRYEGSCDNCDNCARRTAGPAGEADFAPGQRVRHTEWGLGEVQTADADTVVVRFEDVGFKTLASDVVRERGLLTATDRPGNG